MRAASLKIPHCHEPYIQPKYHGQECDTLGVLGPALLLELRDIHREICQAPNGERLQRICNRMQVLKPTILRLSRSGVYKEARQCRDLILNIKTFAAAIIDANRLVSEAKAASLEKLSSQHIDFQPRENRPSEHSQYSLTDGDGQSSDMQHDPYRLWFLNHLSYPYPTPRDCKLLLEQVPSETINQLRTWFTNTRRRSKWSDMYKKYTDCNASKMNKLVEAITSPLSEQTASPLFDVETIEEARADLEAVKEYFGRSEEKKKVSSWINDSIEKTKHLPTAVIRTPESSPTSSAKSSPPSSPTPSPTRKRGRKNAKPSLYAKPNIPVIETYDIPVIAPQQ